jgi:hypothetical protein
MGNSENYTSNKTVFLIVKLYDLELQLLVIISVTIFVN